MQLDRRTIVMSAVGSAALSGLGWPALADVAVSSPASAGFTKAGIAALNQKMHDLVDQQQLAGVTVLVARDGKVVDFDSYGKLDVSGDAAVRHDSIFRMASMTKPIIGVTMMMLWEHGLWKLDDPVAKYIPEFADLKVKDASGAIVPQTRPMTMRQIMSHTAGFGTNGDYANDHLNATDLQGMIDKLSKMPLFAQPGGKWLYGPSVDIQGYIAQKLTGKSLDEVVRTHVTGPLGMADTNFWVDATKSARVARIHNYKDGKIAAVGDANHFPTTKPSYLSGSGGLFSTAGDYYRFCRMVLNGGVADGHRYLKASTVKLMHTSVLEPGVNVTLYRPDTVGLGFGLDFAIVQDAAANHTHQGPESFYWGGAFGTWFWIDPVNKLIVIGLIQNVNGSTPGAGTPPMREISAEAVYAAMKGRRAG